MPSHSNYSTLWGLLLAGFLAPLAWPQAAHAAKLYVNPFAPVGNDANNDCRAKAQPCLTIAYAVTTASSGDEIVLTSSPGLAFGDIDVVVDKSLTFTGDCVGNCPTGRVKINGQTAGRHFDIRANVTVTLSNLELYNGRATNGGSILNGGTLTLVNCYLRDNAATDNGGAVFNDTGSELNISAGPLFNNTGSVTIGRSALSHNSARSGGGVYVAEGSHLSAGAWSILEYNSAEVHGGAVFNDGGDVSANLISFRLNAALDGSGGAIRNTGNGTLSITRSEFFRNRAAIGQGGAIADIGTGEFSIKESQFSQNYATDGGAIHAASPGLGTVVTTIDSVTFDWNKANRNGGAIYYEPVDGQLTIVNSTFSQNSGDVGGALYNSRLNPNGIGRIEVTNSTFYKNAALDGATIYNGRPLTMNNSIVTDSNDLTVGDVDNACRAVELITGAGNLIGIASGGLVDISCDSGGSLSSGFVTGFDTTLGSNGGHDLGAFVAPMKTHALLPNSNAIDLPSATCLVSFDQRGERRPPVAGCDAGAVEQR